MLDWINEISYQLGVDPSWTILIIGLLFLLGIVKCLYPWQPKWKSITTKDENGNEITVHYHLDK